MQGSKETRATTSCTECQRRKQKCSRVWPCNRCQARKVPHMCQFATVKATEESPPQPLSETRGQKRGLSDTQDEPVSSREESQDEVEDGLKAWGYMPGHVLYNLANTAEEDKRASAAAESEPYNEVEKVLHAIPPRTITDVFVNHFLTVVNYRYNTIYGPTFTDNYVKWWADRAGGKRLSPEFTCLLLRILAYSVQYLTTEMRRMIEFELACSSQQLTERFGSAAEQLSSAFSSAKSCLQRVQEQFLKGAWLKSESKIVESWHTLGATIREAQELGMDKEDRVEGLSEFEIEIRRRIWTLLYIWDWQMSAWLGRPHLINQKDCTFVLPTLRLDESESEPNLLSPFAHMALQAMLGRRIAQHLGDIKGREELTAEQILNIEDECESFIEDLPPVFRISNPDLSLDEKHPYYVFQRSQLHVVIHMTQVDFLKTFLTRSPMDKLTKQDDKFRSMGIDLSLRLLEVARELFDHEFPINSKFHLVVFCIFDTATILSSAMIHDKDKTLSRRDEVMDAIETSLEMLHQLSTTTKIGASSYNFLLKLVQASPVLSRHERIRKRQRIDTATATPEEVKVPASQAQPIEDATKTTFTTADSLPQVPITDDLNFDLDQFLQQNPFGNDAQPDMGGLEQIWDWETLHLDGFQPGSIDPLDGFNESPTNGEWVGLRRGLVNESE